MLYKSILKLYNTKLVMSLSGFSIDLGPELDPPYSREWGWMDDKFPLQVSIRARRRRSFKALDRQRERLFSRRNRGPKVIPARELPTEHEAAMEGKPVEVPDPMEEFSAGVSMDALQEIAETQAQRLAA